MTGPEVLDVARDSIVTLVLVAAPLMLIGLAVGVVISLFQALTPNPGNDAGLRPENSGDLRGHAGGASVHGRLNAGSHDADFRTHRERGMTGARQGQDALSQRR
jgi:hypothetical protein